MSISIKRSFLAVSALFLLAAAPLPSLATNVMELRAEQLLMGANFLKDSLSLTPNQQILWQKTAARSSSILRERQSRRERFQVELKGALADPAADPRKLTARLDEETERSNAEEKQLRELWLTVSDALDDRQRTLASQFLVTQLERVDQPDRGSKPEHEQGGPGAGGRHKPGSGGGMGGSSGGMNGSVGGSQRF